MGFTEGDCAYGVLFQGEELSTLPRVWEMSLPLSKGDSSMHCSSPWAGKRLEIPSECWTQTERGTATSTDVGINLWT